MKQILTILIINLVCLAYGGNDNTTSYSITYSANDFLEKPESLNNIRANLDEDAYELFLLRSAEEFISNAVNITQALELGVDMANSEETDLSILGYLIISKLANIIEEQLHNGELKRKDADTKYLLSLLGSKNFFIPERHSDGYKLLMHIKKGNWKYIVKRVKTRSQQYMPLIKKGGHTLIILLSASLLILLGLKIKSKLMKSTIILFLLLLVSQIAKAQVNENDYESTWNNKVVVRILDDGWEYIGQSIYLSRKNNRVKAKYFAGSLNGESAYQRYKSWKRGKNIILCCSGAYTTGDSKETPAGLTIDQGVLINAQISQVWDALMIIEEAGGARVYDLDRKKDLNLLSDNKKVDPRNDYDRKDLISWAEKENATIFQTHLLYYSNKEKIKNAPATAERRLLAIVEDRYGVEHIIFNVEVAVSLTDIARQIYRLIFEQGYNVVGIVNLDTGAKNCFEIYYPNGKKMGFEGDTPLSSASNLLVYYYE